MNDFINRYQMIRLTFICFLLFSPTPVEGITVSSTIMSFLGVYALYGWIASAFEYITGTPLQINLSGLLPRFGAKPKLVQVISVGGQADYEYHYVDTFSKVKRSRRSIESGFNTKEISNGANEFKLLEVDTDIIPVQDGQFKALLNSLTSTTTDLNFSGLRVLCRFFQGQIDGDGNCLSQRSSRIDGTERKQIYNTKKNYDTESSVVFSVDLRKIHPRTAMFA